jgi:hypothetical protein
MTTRTGASADDRRRPEVSLIVALVVVFAACQGSSSKPAQPPAMTTTPALPPATATTGPRASASTAAAEPPTTIRLRRTAGTAPPSELTALTITAPSHEESYDRDADFGGWIDVSGCMNTRAEVLIRTSEVPVTFIRPAGCTVETGRWTDPWSGAVTTVAHDFQIDHTVPLANAWRSGAWSWPPARRIAFANDYADADHLVPIVASENEAKGDRSPDEWKPPDRGAWCRYARAWDRIKAKWHLSATPAEWNTLTTMSATC